MRFSSGRGRPFTAREDHLRLAVRCDWCHPERLEGSYTGRHPTQQARMPQHARAADIHRMQCPFRLHAAALPSGLSSRHCLPRRDAAGAANFEFYRFTQAAWRRIRRPVAVGEPVTMRRALDHEIGDIITGMMRPYLVQRGKTVWCDKSLFTVDFIDQVVQAFPDARYVCLHRHAMDVIASSLEACQWGYRHYGFDEYIQRSTGNFVDALAHYWTDRTAKIVSLEAMADTATFRIHYEHLVRDPHETLAGLLEFLNVKPNKHVIAAMTDEVWDADHGPGWAIRSSASQRRSPDAQLAGAVAFRHR